MAAQTAPMPDVTQFKVDDRWEWRQVDNRTKLQEAVITRIVVEDKGERRFSMENMLRPLVYPYVGEPTAKPWRVWPLEVGKQWSIDMNYVRADGTTGNIRMGARVVAQEEVEVPAGRFMAFRIEQDGFLSTGNFNGRMTETFWYAPAALADVKHMRKVASQNFTRELVSYPRPGEPPVATQGAPAAVPVGSSAPSPVQATTATAPIPPAATQPPGDSRVNRLRELEQLRKEGLITPQEYEDKRKAIMSTL